MKLLGPFIQHPSAKIQVLSESHRTPLSGNSSFIYLSVLVAIPYNFIAMIRHTWHTLCACL